MNTKLVDIAKRANVSVSTVSRIINNSKYVAPDIRDRVNAVIKEIGYSPNRIARSLVTKRSKLIGVIIPDVAQRFYSNLLSGIEEITSQFDYNIIICNISDNLEKEYKYLNILKTMSIDGIIILHEKFSPEVEEFLKSVNVPIVLGSVKASNVDAISITIDDFKAAYEAVDYLIKLGHSKIAMIGGDLNDITTGKNRYTGYLGALKDNGIQYIDRLFKVGNFKISDGYRAMGEILDSREKPTAVFVVSDEMAIGAMNCISDRGLKIPDDISVIGFDDIDLASFTKPRLTTVHQPIKEIGRAAAEVLIKQLKGDSTNEGDIIIPHHLIERESCRRVK